MEHSAALTVNYGLRWDYEGGLEKVITQTTAIIAPRIGVAWTPDQQDRGPRRVRDIL